MNEKDGGCMYTVTIGAEIKNRFHLWLFKWNAAATFKKRMKDITVLGTRPYDLKSKTQEVLIWVDGKVEQAEGQSHE